MALSGLEFQKFMKEFMESWGEHLGEELNTKLLKKYNELKSQGIKDDDLMIRLIAFSSFQTAFKAISLVFAQVYELDGEKEPDMRNVLKLINPDL